MLVYLQQESAFLFILALKVVFPTARVLIREPLHLIGPLLWVFFFSTVPSFSSLPRAIEDSRGCNCLIIQSTSTQAQKLYPAMDLLSRPLCFLSLPNREMLRWPIFYLHPIRDTVGPYYKKEFPRP